jgi:hypothetical protein
MQGHRVKGVGTCQGCGPHLQASLMCVMARLLPLPCDEARAWAHLIRTTIRTTSDGYCERCLDCARRRLARMAEPRQHGVRGTLVYLVQKQKTFLAMCSCPLSLWERGFGVIRRAAKPLTPRPLPRGEGAEGPTHDAQRGALNLH